ncbi:MAG TPA: cytochrome c-type biogenesis protein CcmH [Bryobacteraceae bacterium]|nr:cytochrome c-type biogenesis protein CcmH [Bryobacteraceae bacterium]
MRKFKSSLLVFALAAVCLPQTATQLVTPEIRRVGDRLACKCGACNNTVGTCQMLQCHYTHPARERIAEMQKQGLNDDQIVNSFVKERGLVALAVPPSEGFHLLGWIMPFIAIGFGLIAVWAFLRRNRRKPDLVEIPPDPQRDERYRKRIEQEFSELD